VLTALADRGTGGRLDKGRLRADLAQGAEEATLQSKYGASSSKRKGVVNAFKKQSVKAKVDVTQLRVTATVSIGKAQKLFGTKWSVYKAKSGAHVALPVNTPKLPSGIKGNVDTLAGARLQLASGSSSARTSAVDGGTPTRTGTPALGCTPGSFPSAALSGSGLFPNQILTAYGIAPLQAAGLQGQGARPSPRAATRCSAAPAVPHGPASISRRAGDRQW
jgi:subtilase family serine protease